jgi:hypothetical protein
MVLVSSVGFVVGFWFRWRMCVCFSGLQWIPIHYMYSQIRVLMISCMI